MNALGIDIISCNIQKIDDEKGLIVALGQDNMSQIQKDASIAKAHADRDVKVAEAEASKTANEAEVKAATDIAIMKNDLKIKQAELKKESDIKQAEADAAYQIQQEVQRKLIGVTATEADIAKSEKEIELKKREAEVREQELTAKIEKQANADKYREQQIADVEKYRKQKEAEAEKYAKLQEAEATKVSADALMYQAEKEAEAIRLKGLAEAEAIKAKALAEAEGIDRKAEAMQKMDKAAILDMYFKVLPDVVRGASEPLTKVDKIIQYGDGNSPKLTADIMKTVTQVTEGVKETTGIDLPSVIAGFMGGKALTNNYKVSQDSGNEQPSTEADIVTVTDDEE